ncbi:TRAP transporter small permease [Thalassorhabdus alkalitolerans]|uniref:TRAP transporter small permease n=1 Tax=Thalassorhabdus alkalitolerans TaxID=2282697 RepID=A0ABW0YRN9_9BACI|nr:TRAP transporter small permease [Thalassobacillus sp. C254]
MNTFNRVISILDRSLMKIEELILSFAIIVISVMVIGNVLSRTFTGASWAFNEEISRFALFLATFIGISYVARKGRHISMSAFFDLAPHKIRKALAIIIPLVTAIVLFVLAYYAYGYMASVRDSGRVTAALRFPYYWMLIAVPLGFVLGGIQFLRNAWINIKEKDVYLATDKKDYDRTDGAI